MLDFVLAMAALLMTGIEAAYVPTDEGGGDYLVRVEPDLVKSASSYQFTSDVPADARDVRRVRIFVGDTWPPAVERAVLEASRKPRRAAPVAPRHGRSQTASTRCSGTTRACSAACWSLPASPAA